MRTIHQGRSKRNDKLQTFKSILLYTLAFAIVFFLGYRDFLIDQGLSFIWHNDGVYQHYPFLYDWTQTIQSFLAHPENGFPMWSWNLGYGADIIQSYSYYILGDPLNLIMSMIAPLQYIEIGYSVLIVLRFFLAGLAFLSYCLYMEKNRVSSIAGSLIYVFGAYMLFWGIRHPYFPNPTILLPLLFIGIEEILKGKKLTVFVLVVGISAFNNFYFFYMNTIAVFIYALIRFSDSIDIGRIRKFIALFIRTALSYVLGLMLSAVLFLPSVYAFMNSVKVDNSYLSFGLFDFEYYLLTFKRLVFIGIGGSAPYITVSGILIPALIFLFIHKDRLSNSFRKLFVIFSLFLGLPVMYSVFNGFSSPTTRWSYIYIFILAFIIVIFLDRIDSITKIELKKVAFFAVMFFSASALVYAYSRGYQPREFRLLSFLAPTACVVLSLLGIWWITLKRSNNIRPNTRWTSVLIVLLIMGNLIINISIFMNTYDSQFVQFNTLKMEFDNSITSLAKTLEDDSFYRVDFNDGRNNKALVNNFYSPYLFNSILNSNNMELYFQNNIRTTIHRAGFNGVDNISALDSILGIKYYLLYDHQLSTLPYGFRQIEKSGDKNIFINDHALPLGFVYYHSVKASEASKLNDIDRTQLMLEAAVVESDHVSLPAIDVQPISSQVEYEIIGEENARVSGQTLVVDESDGGIELKIPNIINSELYVEIEGIHYKNDSSSFTVNVSTNGVSKKKLIRSATDTYYMKNHDMLFNMCYAQNRNDTIKIQFSRAGEYTIKGIKVYQVEMDTFDDKIQQLHSSTLQDIVIGKNSFSGKVELDREGVLFLSIPYSSGWDVYADGKIVDPIKVNYSFTGILLNEGVHEIVMEYETPMLKESIWISAAGLFIFIILLIYPRRIR